MAHLFVSIYAYFGKVGNPNLQIPVPDNLFEAVVCKQGEFTGLAHQLIVVPKPTDEQTAYSPTYSTEKICK
jgi:hypothetical protein